jgi:outer membrane protein assembly factor BamB
VGLLLSGCGSRGLRLSLSDPVLGGALEPGPRPPLRLLWSASLGAAPIDAALVRPGLVLQLTTAPALVALDPRTGDRLGRQGLPAMPAGGPALSGELLVVSLLGTPSRLRALDLVRGRTCWELPGASAVPLCSVGDTLLAAGEDGVVRAVQMASGEEVWRAALQPRPQAAPSLAGGTVYANDGSHGLAALEAETGAVRWRAELAARPRTQPLVHAGRVIVGLADGTLVALDPATGTEAWRAALSGVPAPLLVAGEGLVVAATSDGTLNAVEVESGEQRWTFSTRGTIRGALALAEKVVYCGSADHRVYGVSLTTGESVWEDRLDGPSMTGVTVGEGVVLVASEKGTIHAFATR